MAFDLSALSAITGSLGLARQLGTAAIEIRDFNKLATEISKINGELLKAQDGLLALQTGMIALQQEHLQATQKLAEMEKSIAERGNYTLVDMGHGDFAYGVNVVPEESGSSEPGKAQEVHHLCQACFDGPGQRKVVLRPNNRGWLHCSVCQSVFNVGA